MRFQSTDLTQDRASSSNPSRSGILCKLRRSRLMRATAGATLPMMAASLVPLIGIIGGGVDMTRGYLVKTRLQQACDAGALAARRSMDGNTLTEADIAAGENFFNVNLRDGAWGAEGIGVTYSAVLDEDDEPTGAVHGDATAEVPLSLMRVFWPSGSMDITTDCQAELNVTNNDIMFVLDTTGSMACLPADSYSTCVGRMGNWAGTSPNNFITEQANSRIDGLRGAVEDFVETLANATPDSARLRVGFVSYSSNVRVGEVVRDGVANSFPTTYSYPTRVANFTTAVYDQVSQSSSSVNQTHPNQVTPATCRTYGDAADSTSGSQASGQTITTAYARYSWNGNTSVNSWGTGTSLRTCIRRVTTTTTNWSPLRYRFTSWSNATRSFNITDFVEGNTVMLASFSNPSTSARTTTSGTWTVQELADKQDDGTAWGLTLAAATAWDGCIIERSTGPDDIDTPPTSDATRWAPAWPQIYRSGTSQPVTNTWNINYTCPKDATRLFNVTSADLSDVREYVNVLNGAQTFAPSDFLPAGRTYHTIGMVWGVRLMSPEGMFSADHGAAPNGRPVNRHIIFMTDGAMDTSDDSYSAYGLDASGNAAHNVRFVAACQAAKDRGISVWVVSFAMSLTTELEDCADDGQAFQASNTEELNDMFQTIAQRIAELRITE